MKAGKLLVSYQSLLNCWVDYLNYFTPALEWLWRKKIKKKVKTIVKTLGHDCEIYI